MPHLSPITWLMGPLSFLLFILLFSTSAFWWAQSPIFPISKSSSTQNLNPWNWN